MVHSAETKQQLRETAVLDVFKYGVSALLLYLTRNGLHAIRGREEKSDFSGLRGKSALKRVFNASTNSSS